VIVATSTLELGIDVGDLDRVIQIGAPATVASLLQRIGRTGRRAETTRNCLFLATSEMELLQALALILLVLDHWVEPLVAPPEPVNLVAQQLLARVLAEGRVGRSTWPGSFDAVRSQAELDPAIPETVLDHMLSRLLLVEDTSIVAIGPTGEEEYGRRNFMDVTSLFLTEPLLAVRWGQRDLGYVDPSSLAAREDTRATILLGGRAWGVRDVDWNRRVVWVEPVDEPGKSRWSGAGRALSWEVCQAIRAVLCGDDRLAPHLSSRANTKLAELQDEDDWVRPDGTTLFRDTTRSRSRWWTFGGARANRALAHALDTAGVATMAVDDLSIGLRGTTTLDAIRAITDATDPATLRMPVEPRRLDAIKFASCVPDAALRRMISERDADEAAVARVLGEPITLASR
jgi:ATP-dependent Lhr-like helicase